MLRKKIVSVVITIILLLVLVMPVQSYAQEIIFVIVDGEQMLVNDRFWDQNTNTGIFSMNFKFRDDSTIKEFSADVAIQGKRYAVVLKDDEMLSYSHIGEKTANYEKDDFLRTWEENFIAPNKGIKSVNFTVTKDALMVSINDGYPMKNTPEDETTILDKIGRSTLLILEDQK